MAGDSQRGMRKVSYAKLPAGSASLAAAEAFVFNVDAIINPDPKDLEDLGKMLRFLKAHEQAAASGDGEHRRGRQSFAAPGRGAEPADAAQPAVSRWCRRRIATLDLNVQLGTPDFPAEAAANPYEICRSRPRETRRRQTARPPVWHQHGHCPAHRRRERARGSICSRSAAGASRTPARRRHSRSGAGALSTREVCRIRRQSRSEAQRTCVIPATTTEFWVPDFNTCAIVDLEAMK